MMYLEDIVVTESMRRRGVGRRLFERVVESSRAQNCQLLKWQVLDWNSNAVKFYESYGCAIEVGWVM